MSDVFSLALEGTCGFTLEFGGRVGVGAGWHGEGEILMFVGADFMSRVVRNLGG